VLADAKQFKQLWRKHTGRLLIGLGPKQLYHEEIVMRSLGLAPIYFSMDDLRHESAAGLRAFYDYAGKRLVVRGHALGVATRAEIAHQLTYALQDQEFHAGARLHAMRTLDATQVYDALLQGDAARVAVAYIQKLSRSDQRKVLEASGTEYEASGIAWPMFAAGGGPYAFGPTLVAALQLDGGDRAIDRAFRDPPTHQVQALNPTADASQLRSVPAPTRAAGDEPIGPPAPIGATTLYVVLANRIDPVLAMTAADAWGGSSAQAFIHDGDPCVRATFRGATGAAHASLAAAVRQWVESDPDDASSVHESAESITLDSCGSRSTGYDLGAVSRVAVPLILRNQVVLAELQQGEEHDVSKCIGDAVVADPGMAAITTALVDQGEPTARQQQEIASIIGVATTTCKTRPT
jgi:hypothetical protein